MRTDLTFDRYDDFDPSVSDSDLIGYFKPSEIVHDPVLTLARKRQLLAYWASDIHAVTGSPALRSYAFGTAVSIDEIQAALRELDTMVDAGAMPHGRGASVSA
ncbi:MAG TPA: hypothetical protein VFE52_04940 [Devosia sp.]|jgi:hypothetical protein|nr:hypothetical protein [Devosia sp.]